MQANHVVKGNRTFCCVLRAKRDRAAQQPPCSPHPTSQTSPPHRMSLVFNRDLLSTFNFRLSTTAIQLTAASAAVTTTTVELLNGARNSSTKQNKIAT